MARAVITMIMTTVMTTAMTTITTMIMTEATPAPPMSDQEAERRRS
jgi:hypothetical protein